ncbi:DMT family transporter [Kineococcus sp. NUM-3379]
MTLTGDRPHRPPDIPPHRPPDIPPPRPPGAPPQPPPGGALVAAVLAGAGAMAFVGGSTGVSAVLADAPLAAAQALRYAVACALLVTAARLGGRVLRRPRGAEWAWLAAVTGTGLVLFNLALVRGSEHADPAVFGVAVAGVPLVLALAAPLAQHRRPAARAVLAAGVVTTGAVLVEGAGRSDATGLLWAVLVLACEVGFTLLAVPVLRRHGPWGVSVHTTWMAAAGFGAWALADTARHGSDAALRLGGAHLLAVAYLAVAVTAVAFVLWYSSVRALGAGRAGLLTAVAPVSAALSGTVLGGPLPAAPVWAGIAVVGLGLALGLRAARPGRS